MEMTECGKHGKPYSRLPTLPTLFGNPFRIPTLLRPRRRVRCLGATAKTSHNLNSSPQLRKGLVTDVPGPMCNGCSGTLASPTIARSGALRMGHPGGWVEVEEGGRASHDAHISESRCGAPGTRDEVVASPNHRAIRRAQDGAPGRLGGVEEGGRASHDAHISESRCGAPGTRDEVVASPNHRAIQARSGWGTRAVGWGGGGRSCFARCPHLRIETGAPGTRDEVVASPTIARSGALRMGHPASVGR
jgi:hypothetical protein